MSSARLSCSDMQVRADSAVLYQESGMYHLFGRVRIDNLEVRLESQEAQYYSDTRLITAQQDVRLERKADGTVLTGQSLSLYEETPARPEELRISGGRPRAVLYPARPEGAPADSVVEPYVIDADDMVIRGDDFEADGQVEIRRGELDASGERMRYFQSSGQLQLLQGARLHTDRFDLAGNTVTVMMPEDQIGEVIAQGDARLSGELSLEGSTIELGFAEGALERVLVHEGASAARVRPVQPGVIPPAPPRARAISEDLSVEGDRLEIQLAQEQIQTVYATGRALFLTSAGDSLNAPDTPEIARRDRIEGDTIEAVFTPVESDEVVDDAPPPATDLPPSDDVPAAAADSLPLPDDAPPVAPETPLPAASDSVGEPRPQLEYLVARGNARALYRMQPGDTTNASDPACSGPGRFAIHYVVGDTITIAMRDGTVEEMQVIGQVAGTHLEPPACTPSPQPAGAEPAPPAGGSADPAVPAPTPPPGGGPPPARESAAAPPPVSAARRMS